MDWLLFLLLFRSALSLSVGQIQARRVQQSIDDKTRVVDGIIISQDFGHREQVECKRQVGQGQRFTCPNYHSPYFGILKRNQILEIVINGLRI